MNSKRRTSSYPLLVAALAMGIIVIPVAAQTQKSASAGDVSAKPMANGPQTGQDVFPSAAKATEQLVTAMQKDDVASLLRVLGPDAKDIISSGDETEDRTNRREFVEKYEQMHRLVMEPDGTTTLYIGAENWPTPIPLVHKDNSWYFDTAAGKQEVLYRRVGKNELAAIEVCQQLVDAEKEYYGQPHDGESPHYAQKLISDPGKHDGLYWETSAGETPSPIGPLVASASQDASRESADQKLQPFQGYYFKILRTRGSKSGKLTQGFAFVAYPAEYRSSGVMTFMVDQDGIVYEKDLGPRTSETAKTITRYHVDASWRKAD
ncbi:MAG: DUF2950 domain-containing protein [Candidatus Sulfotelmatobacter sp.]